MDEEGLSRAAEAVASAGALLVGAGAGMGVDSGLPDFRGPEGFWRAYPAYGQLGLRFEELAQPRWFAQDPTLAWGFYGHRLALYRKTVPHEGFAILRRWAERMRHGAFALTSNVDGQFQRAGFAEERVYELHGAIEWLQCTRCKVEPWLSPDEDVVVDEASGRATSPLPSCPRCGALARPNVLMFNDHGWDGQRSDAQEEHFTRWIGGAGAARAVIIECGAGTAIPSVRMACERAARAVHGTLVRINPREPQAPPDAVSLAAGALEALRAIDARLC